MKSAVLSLEELESYDSRPMRSEREFRYCCPYCGDSKPRDDAHRCLCLNTDSGLWNCKRCKRAGLIKEKQSKLTGRSKRQRTAEALERIFSLESVPTPAKANENRAEGIYSEIYAESLPLTGTPGENYLKSRGIPLALAEDAAVRFSQKFYGRPAVIFPIHFSNL